MAGIKDVIKTLDDASEVFDKVVTKSQMKIYAEAVTLMKGLEVDGQGKVKQTIANLKLLVSIKSKLAAVSNNKEYLAGVGKFLQYFDALQKEQNAYFSANFPQATIGEQAKKRHEAMKQIAVQNVIDALTGDGLKANVMDKVNDILLRAVTTGAKFSNLQEELRAHLIGVDGGTGALSRYATTYATTAISQFTGQNNKLLTQDLGVKWFMYTGSTKETTREFCEHLVKKRYIHRSEFHKILQGDIDGHQCGIYAKTGLPFGMIEGTNEDNFQVNCGGWNCRHQLVPVSELAVPQELRDKFPDEEPVKEVETKPEPINLDDGEYGQKTIAIKEYLTKHKSGKVLSYLANIQDAAKSGNVEQLDALIKAAQDVIKKNLGSLDYKAKMKEIASLQPQIDSILQYVSDHPKSGLVVSYYGEILSAKKNGDVDVIKEFIQKATKTIAKNEGSNKQKAAKKAQKADTPINNIPLTKERINALGVLSTMKGIKGLSLVELENALENNDVDAVEKEVAKIRQFKEKLESLSMLKNPIEDAKNFTYDELKEVNDSIADMLKHGSIDSKIYTCGFEANWVKSKKKYPTWEVAYNGYLAQKEKLEKSKQWSGVRAKISAIKSEIGNKFSAKIAQIEDAINKSDIDLVDSLIRELEKWKGIIGMYKIAKGKSNGTQEENNLFGIADMAIDSGDLSAADKAVKDVLSLYLTETERYVLQNYTSKFTVNSQESYTDVMTKLGDVTKDAWQGAEEEQRAAFPYYTNDSSHSRAILTDVGLGKKNEYADKMDAILDKIHIKEDLVVRSGQDYCMAEYIWNADFRSLLEAEDLDGLNDTYAGLIGVNKAYMSTSFNKEGGFTKEFELHLFLPKGTSCMNVNEISSFGHGQGTKWDGYSFYPDWYPTGETEIFLHRGYQYKFIRAEKGTGKGGKNRLYVQVLDRV